MRPNSFVAVFVAVFVAHIVVGNLVLAPPAAAATVVVNVDTTITASNDGTNGAAGAANADGSDGTPSLQWDADGVDVFLDQTAASLVFTGGSGGAAGADAANNGGNAGGFGAAALDMSFLNGSAGSVTLSNAITIQGGMGGAGSAGGAGGAADTDGGDGGYGGAGIAIGANGNILNLSGTIIYGGAGGVGGAAGDAAGDATDNNSGGDGGNGGQGIFIAGGIGGTVLNLNNVFVSGGSGNHGGASLTNGANSNGGDGGSGIYDDGDATVINIVNSSILGGGGGLRGLFGIGGAHGTGGAALFLTGTGGADNEVNIDADSFVSGSSDSLAAIYIDSGASPHINNHGEIGAESGHDASAVLIAGASGPNALFNFLGGKIHSTGTAATIWGAGTGSLGGNTFNNAGVIRNYGFGHAIDISKWGATAVNSGVIQAEDASALVVRDGGGGMTTYFNNTGGSILNNSATHATIVLNHTTNLALAGGSVANADVGGDAIRLGGSFSGPELRLEDASVSGNIVFANDAKYLRLDSATTVDGNIEFAGGVNDLRFSSGLGSGTGAQTIAAGSTLTTTGGGTVNILVFGSANAVIDADWGANTNIASLDVDAGGAVTFNNNVTAATITNDGTLRIASGKSLNATTSFTSGGAIVFGVASDGTAAQIHSLNGIDLTGSTIGISLDNPASTFVSGTNLLLGSDFDLGDIGGITNGTLLTDNSALMQFFLYRGDAPEIGGNSYQFFAQVQVALLADIAGEGDDPNSIALGAALDEIGLDGDQDIDDLMLTLALLPTNEDINEVLDALLPETDGIGYDIAKDLGEQVLDLASKRLDGLRGTQMAGEYKLAGLVPVAMRGSVDETRRGAGRFWVQAFGRAADQGRHSFNTGYDAGSYGFAGGADVALSQTTQLGGALSYASTDADGNGINLTDTQVDSYQLTLYGDHLFDNAVYAKGILAYGWHLSDIARHNVGGVPGNTATGGYDASQFNLRAEVGRAYVAGGNLALMPRATLAAAWYSPDGYTEQGVGGLGLTVAPDDLTSVRLGLGVLARWSVHLSGDELFQPELRLDYRRDLTRERFETTSEFLGAPGFAFRTQGVEQPADILNLGVGALLATAGGVDLRASYDVELKEDYVAHAGYVRASIPF